jgi:predicted nicotinamide N-methyase
MLARHLAHSSLVAPGVRVLEIGCGLGLCGIAAARRGANVTMTDFNEDAVEAAARNARLNAVDAACVRFDWNDEPPSAWIDSVDLLIASDVLYAADGVGPVARLVRRLSCAGLIADPLRPQSAGAAAAFEREGLRVWSTPAEGGRIMMLSEG